MDFLLFITIAGLLFADGLAEVKLTSVIETDSGPVRGKILTTVRDAVKFSSFTGIPYGEPPVGYLRFKPPVEKSKWTEIFDSTKEGNICLQPMMSSKLITIGDEDCLNINVYTPYTDFPSSNNDLKPVMFWIYGGGFISGFSLDFIMRPDFLIENDIVVVSPNYRLGPLGFLNLHHENATGNAGLKDQSLALKWVKKNIHLFGGDPNRVTIFGQSAGGTSVDHHILSEMSTGLFQRAISMSESPLNHFSGTQRGVDAEARAFALGAELGYNGNDKDALLTALYSASANKIVSKSHELPFFSFRPSIEKEFKKGEAFLTECPLDKYNSGNYNKVPYMTGFTSNEVKTFFKILPKNVFKNLLSSILETFSSGGINLNIPIFQEYINLPRFTHLSKERNQELVETVTDLAFASGVDSKQKFINLKNSHQTYYYRFSFDISPYLFPHIPESITGAGHCEDLLHLFYTPGIPINQPDINITTHRLVRLYTNFAKYGNPTPLGQEDELLNITWPISGSKGLHLDINRNLTVGSRPINDRIKSYEDAGVGSSLELNGCNDKNQ